MKSEHKEIEVRPYNLKQLADLYSISTITMRKWIQRFESELSKQPGSRLFTSKQVEIIFDKLGRP